MTKQARNILTLAAYVGFQLITQFGIAIIAINRPPLSQMYSDYAVLIIVSTLLLDGLLIFFQKPTKESIQQTVKNWKSLLKKIGGGLLLAAGFILVEGLISLISAPQANSITQNAATTIHHQFWFILIPLLLLPIAEEIVFRKAAVSVLQDELHLNLLVASVLSVCGFAFAHYLIAGQFLIYLIMGLYMQLIYNKWRSLPLNILTHTAINTWPLIILLLSH